MRVALDKFACSSIRTEIGPDLQSAARTALLHYVLKLKLGRPPIGVPQDMVPPEDPEASFELTVDNATQELLTREARRQGTTLSQLAIHSVFLYLAELDLLNSSPSRGH